MMQPRRVFCRFYAYMYHNVMTQYSRSFVQVQHLPQVFLTSISAPICSRFSSSNVIHNIPPKVEHSSDTKRFFVEVQDVVAYLEYERENQLIKLMHTEVPTVLGGRGLGKLLAKKALEYVAKNDFLLEIHCPFVRSYVSKYAPKYIKYLKQ